MSVNRIKRQAKDGSKTQASPPTLEYSAPVRVVRDYLNCLREKLSSRYRSSFDLIENETKVRMARNETALFSHPFIRAPVFIAALVVFLSILKYTELPRHMGKILELEKNVILSPQVELCFGIDCLKKADKIHHVKLPFFDIRKFPDFQEKDLFYRIRVSIPSEKKDKRIDTLVVPLVWGDSTVYRSGVMVASGPNIWPIVPILSPTDDIVIHVESPSGSKYGIRGTFPPFLSDKKFARDIESELLREPFKSQYAFVAQLSGFCLLLIMYLSFPYRPELFAFLVLFGLETLRGWLYFNTRAGVVLLSPLIDKIIDSLLLITATFTVVFFIGMFFRRSVSEVWSFLSHRIGWILGTMIVVYIFAVSTFSSLSSDNALFIAAWLTVTFISGFLVKDTIIYLFCQRLNIRLALGFCALLGVGYWAAVNIYDHFLLNTAITSTHTNHLHFFYIMSVVLGIEIGRTEVKTKEAFSLLPKEVVRLIHDKKESWREGVVVLVDVVGWSSKLNHLDETETPDFMRKINEYLLAAFDEPNVSVSTGTGDGFYLTIEGEPSEEQFDKLLSGCKNLAQLRPRFEELGIDFKKIKQERLIVRSMIGYGRYYAGMAKIKNLKKDFLAGFIATQLARGIGDDSDPKGPRIICGSRLDKHQGGRPTLSQVTKGETIRYWLWS